MRKILVSVAPAGTDTPEGVQNPLSPEQIAAETIACAEAGAGMVHLHVRDAAGNQVADITEFSKTLTLIREGSDIIIQGSTGGVSELSLEERCTALNDPRVEVASLNMGSANFDEGVYINTLPDIRYWAGRMKETEVLPELEIFEAGMINNVKLLHDEKVLQKPLIYNFCLGVKGALPASADSVHFLKSIIPSDAAWGLVHHGMGDLSLLATAIGMGASFVRVGFEDSVYLAPGKMAKTNMDLVENVVSLIHQMGMEIATPAEARKSVLGLAT
ncbi:3-keto-5-aminohexanoate cleavage protein [Candidatus Poribacteria bacterium]